MKRGRLVAIVAATLLAACDRGTGPAGAPAASSAAASAPAAAVAASGPLIAPRIVAAPDDALRSVGAALAAQGGGGVAACSSCHGAQGEGNPAAGIPRIAGQSWVYLLHQLDSYADERRRNAVMGPIAKAMDARQRQAAAAHYASVTAAASPAAAASGNLGRGEQLARTGDDSRQLQACANCHGPLGQGAGPGNPYLAGQGAGYLVAALAAWRDGTRNNDPSGQMPALARALDAADIDAVATHFARLAPPAIPRDQDTGQRFASTGPALVSGPRSGGEQAMQGVGSEQGAALTGGAMGPGGGGANSGAGPTGSRSGAADGGLGAAASAPVGGSAARP